VDLLGICSYRRGLVRIGEKIITYSKDHDVFETFGKLITFVILLELFSILLSRVLFAVLENLTLCIYGRRIGYELHKS